MAKENKIKKFVKKFENSWIFWTIFILGFIELGSTLLGGFEGAIYGVIYFPLGLMFFIPLLRDVIGSMAFLRLGYILTYYGLLGFIVSMIVRDKKFNTKLILLLIGILVLTFIGCVQLSNY